STSSELSLVTSPVLVGAGGTPGAAPVSVGVTEGCGTPGTEPDGGVSGTEPSGDVTLAPPEGTPGCDVEPAFEPSGAGMPSCSPEPHPAKNPVARTTRGQAESFMLSL